MKNLFRSLSGAAVAAAVVVVSVVLPAASASGETEAPAASVAPTLDRQPVSGPGFTPPPAPETNGKQSRAGWVGPYTYRNYRANKCLDILNASPYTGAPAVHYTCLAGRSSQLWWEWMTEMNGSGYSRLFANNLSGYCLHTDGTNIPIKQFRCVTLPQQIFDTTEVNPGLIQQHPYGCMEIAGGDPNNNARIVTWPCHGQLHQIWAKWHA